MINKASSRIILSNTSPLFDQQKYSPSNKIGVLLNDNVIKVKKGSALEEFINERKELKEKIRKLNEKVEEASKTNNKVEINDQKNNDQEVQEDKTIDSNSGENTKKKLEDRLEKVDKLITGYEKGFLVNSTDKNQDRNQDGMSLLA